jgi:hypothetical protein
VPCPGGSGDLAGGCHVGLSASPAVGGVGGFVSVVNEGGVGDVGLVLEIVIKNGPVRNLQGVWRQQRQRLVNRAMKIRTDQTFRAAW